MQVLVKECITLEMLTGALLFDASKSYSNNSFTLYTLCTALFAFIRDIFSVLLGHRLRNVHCLYMLYCKVLRHLHT